MHSFFRSILVVLLSGTLFFACGSSGGEKTDDNHSSSDPEKSIISAAEEKPADNDIPAEIMENGAKVYHNYCMACHQMNGSGNPGMYPPLTDNETVKGDKEKLINIILHGMSGEIEVKGEIYNQVMAPHDFLSNKEVADLLTYLRNSFENSASPVTEDEVQKVRESSSQS